MEDNRTISINEFNEQYPYISRFITWEKVKKILDLKNSNTFQEYEERIPLHELLKAVALELFNILRPAIDKDNVGLDHFIKYFRFFIVPAGAKFPCNYTGGLIHHSLNVTEFLLEYTEKLGLEWRRKQSPMIIGLLHDVCKCDEYIGHANGEYLKNCETLFYGHGSKSLHILQTLNFKLTEEEIVCIRYHMGAFTEREEWNYYTRAVQLYPNVLYAHMADIAATHIKDREI